MLVVTSKIKNSLKIKFVTYFSLCVRARAHEHMYVGALALTDNSTHACAPGDRGWHGGTFLNHSSQMFTLNTAHLSG